VFLTAAVSRVRAAAGVLADLIETATDLHDLTLAGHLGLPTDSPPTDVGQAITGRLDPIAAALGTQPATVSSASCPPLDVPKSWLVWA
jgi:hypothetical protein